MGGRGSGGGVSERLNKGGYDINHLFLPHALESFLVPPVKSLFTISRPLDLTGRYQHLSRCRCNMQVQV